MAVGDQRSEESRADRSSRSPSAPASFDALLPKDMARRAEDVGHRKAELDGLSLFVLALLAGAFIAFGAIFATTVGAGSLTIKGSEGQVLLTGMLPYGLTRLVTGLAFSLGLVLVIVGGAELFTSNTLVAIAWASGKVRTSRLLFTWAVVFVGNCVGAISTAILMFFSGQYTFGAGAVGLNALQMAQGKVSLDFFQAFVLGLLCNTLVCLAAWMCYSARTTTDRIVTIVMPTAAFVAAGFEHSIANVYFVPFALLIKAGAPASFWSMLGRTASDFETLTWSAFLVNNLLPVTIGNMVGGSCMVGAVYWFIYLRPR